MMIGLKVGCKHDGWLGCTQPRPSAWESEREHRDAYDDLLGKTPDQINHCGERTLRTVGEGPIAEERRDVLSAVHCSFACLRHGKMECSTALQSPKARDCHAVFVGECSGRVQMVCITMAGRWAD